MPFLCWYLRACAGGCSHPAQEAQSENWGSEANLPGGTWIGRVTQHDCQSGATLGAPFLSLLTFARGGTMTETTSNPMFAPPIARGPGHGVSGSTGHHTYTASSIALITVNGVLAKTQVITQTIKIANNPDVGPTPAKRCTRRFGLARGARLRLPDSPVGLAPFLPQPPSLFPF